MSFFLGIGLGACIVYIVLTLNDREWRETVERKNETIKACHEEIQRLRAERETGKLDNVE